MDDDNIRDVTKIPQDELKEVMRKERGDDLAALLSISRRNYENDMSPRLFAAIYGTFGAAAGGVGGLVGGAYNWYKTGDSMEILYWAGIGTAVTGTASITIAYAAQHLRHFF